MRGHWMTGDGIPAAFSFPQRGAILLAADPNTWWVRGREPPEPNVGIESEKRGGKKRKEEKKRCTSPSSEAVKAARSRSQGREAAGKGCVTSTERGAQGGRAAVRAEPLSATAPRHRHFSYCYLQASLHCLCSSQGWVTRSRSLRAQIRPQTPKEKTKQGRGAEPRKRGLSQRSSSGADHPSPPRGASPPSRSHPAGSSPGHEGDAARPHVPPHSRGVAVPLRVLMPPRNLLYSFESIALPGAPRLSRTHWAGGVPQRSARPTTAALWPPQPCAS